MLNISSSDEDLEELIGLFERPKNANFVKDTVPQLSDEQFIEHFRISRKLA